MKYPSFLSGDLAAIDAITCELHSSLKEITQVAKVRRSPNLRQNSSRRTPLSPSMRVVLHAVLFSSNHHQAQLLVTSCFWLSASAAIVSFLPWRSVSSAGSGTPCSYVDVVLQAQDINLPEIQMRFTRLQSSSFAD